MKRWSIKALTGFSPLERNHARIILSLYLSVFWGKVKTVCLNQRIGSVLKVDRILRPLLPPHRYKNNKNLNLGVEKPVCQWRVG